MANMRSPSRSCQRRGVALAETDFSIVYDGSALTQGRIPVRDLAPSLFALGEVFTEANRLVNPGGVDVALEIVATDAGSFDVHLVLSTLGGELNDLFTSDPVTALVNFKELVIGGGIGLFWLVRHIRRRRITNREPLGDGRVRVTLNDGTSVEIPARTLDMYGSVRVRQNAREVIAPLDREGIDKIEFRERDQQVTVSIGDDEVDAFDVPADESTDELLAEETGVIALTIENIPLTHPQDAWRFNDGERGFRAAMEDPNFAGRVSGGIEVFRAGDILVSQIRRRQFRTQAGRLRNEWTVLSVDRHIAASPPPQLPGMEDGGPES